ncbi:MAG: ATP synthase subunit I [Syntrophotaleaceae bacterium]
MTNDERLLADIARRNWLILIGLVLLSLLAKSFSFTLGVAGGGVVAIGSYHWLHASLAGLLKPGEPKSRIKYLLTYLTRLLVLGVALYLVLVPGKAHPVGLAVGVSVVMLNLTWTSVTRLLGKRDGGS